MTETFVPMIALIVALLAAFGTGNRANGRFDRVAGLATAKIFVELRSRQKPQIGRCRPTPETALLKRYLPRPPAASTQLLREWRSGT